MAFDIFVKRKKKYFIFIDVDKTNVPAAMSSLICDLHLWSLREDLTVRDTDFSCFKYYDKANQKAVLDKPYAQVRVDGAPSLFPNPLCRIAKYAFLFQDKLSFAFGRGHTNFLDSKRPAKLRNNFKELEEVLEQQQLVFAEVYKMTG